MHVKWLRDAALAPAASLLINDNTRKNAGDGGGRGERGEVQRGVSTGSLQRVAPGFLLWLQDVCVTPGPAVLAD